MFRGDENDVCGRFLEENICWLVTLTVTGILSAVVFCVKLTVFSKASG